MFELRCSVSNALANGQRVLFVPGGLFLVSTRRTANRPGKSPCAQDFEEKLSVVALACSFVLAWAAAVASATRLRVSLSRCCINQARLRTPKPLRGFSARNSRRYVLAQ